MLSDEDVGFRLVHTHRKEIDPRGFVPPSRFQSLFIPTPMVSAERHVLAGNASREQTVDEILPSTIFTLFDDPFNYRVEKVKEHTWQHSSFDINRNSNKSFQSNLFFFRFFLFLFYLLWFYFSSILFLFVFLFLSTYTTLVSIVVETGIMCLYERVSNCIFKK